MKKGYHKIRPLEGGLDAWIDSGAEFQVYATEN
jgi:hypothetical protein